MCLFFITPITARRLQFSSANRYSGILSTLACAQRTTSSSKFSTSATSKQVAIVTGASRGIGRAIALRLSHDGFDISLNDLSEWHSIGHLKDLQTEITDLGRKCAVSFGDVSNENDVKGLVDETAGRLGGVDVIVANAGICTSSSLIETQTEDIDRIYNINIRGVFLCYKYAAMQMIKQGRGGRLIGASSLAGKQGYADMSAYSMSKFAVRGLTQSVAGELGRYGITVNAYSPGAIDTDMLRELGDSMAGDSGSFYDQQSKLTAVSRVGNTEDVATVVSFWHLVSLGLLQVKVSRRMEEYISIERYLFLS